tara:strand:- start:597 stop:827 length:231 start_codon:yes stop_codon:yes gene_type:complete
MAKNDPVNDRYNPPGLGSNDFERFQFSELEVGDLFWQSNQPGDNLSWRKENQTQAKNLRKQTIHNFDARAIVWQKI